MSSSSGPVGPETKRRNRTSYSGDSEEQHISKRSRFAVTRSLNEDSPQPIFTSCKEVVTYFATLDILPLRPPRLSRPTDKEMKELETALGFGMREDWSGCLACADEDIVNPKGKKKESFRQPLLVWAENNEYSKNLLEILIRFVYSMDTAPSEAKRILSAALASRPCSVKEIESAMRRICYDPVVLEEDGWITTKSSTSSGSIGGPFLIGDMVRWQNSDAVVIAFVHDDDIGDLWKACWIEDMMTFDLEAEEIIEARKKWERRNKPKTQGPEFGLSKQSRANGSSDFRVAGVDEGIVLASSHNGRPGVFWPARVMNASETPEGSAQTKRSISKYKISVVFLAPYWDSSFKPTRVRRGPLSEQTDDSFGPVELFQVETVEANTDTIKVYPFEPHNGVDVAQLEVAFRFTGLPKSAFGRFVDSHRLALSLKQYSKTHLKEKTFGTEEASVPLFGLFDTHPISVLAPVFPSIVLHLPFSYILSQLPVFTRGEVAFNGSHVESVLNLASIVDNMKPPNCWKTTEKSVDQVGSNGTAVVNPAQTSNLDGTTNTAVKIDAQNINSVLLPFPNLQSFFSLHSGNPAVESLSFAVMKFYTAASHQPNNLDVDTANPSNSNSPTLPDLIKAWATLKAHAEDLIDTVIDKKKAVILSEWRRLAEDLYNMLVTKKQTRKSTLVISDYRCNLHVTAGLNMERSVRLPAALKGVQLAKSVYNSHIHLVPSVEQSMSEYIESTLLPQVHDSVYLNRMKGRCLSAKSEEEILMLTEDSDGNGGEDTRGCQRSWDAALYAVTAAVTAVDNVVSGQACNSFCATRPPGHHAGKKLHAMKAVSNGFCILNCAASAAIHAVSPVAAGGLGLRRVCVIDFDVHHGNGTQDILCSTYDPRFLYVSLHAGGASTVGEPKVYDYPRQKDHGSIFPGRCGDSSPHKGVLNIPLGTKVTAHAVGNALLARVTPAVDAFSPELVILSAGFDAHKNDPMDLGSLTAEDFGHITEVACQLASKSCSGRVVSILEGGYGVPCCRRQVGVAPSTNDVPTTNGAVCLPTSDSPETQKKESAKNGLSEAKKDEANTSVASLTESTSVEPSQNGTSLSNDTGKIDVVKSCNEDKPLREDVTNDLKTEVNASSNKEQDSGIPAPRPQPSKLADLGDLLPAHMDDQVPLGLQRKLEPCHNEGFIECVREHISALARFGSRRSLAE